MIAFLKGFIEEISEDTLQLDVQNVGYNIRITTSCAASLSGEKGIVKIYTYMSVKEDGVGLFGFLTKNELEIFKKCISVNGIGPKAAISILSTMDADTLRFAILSGDAKAISKAPGVGSKMAERLILELKDKLPADDSYFDMEANAYASQTSLEGAQTQEAVAALVSLGYNQTEARKAIQSVVGAENMDSGEILRLALKQLY